MSSSSIAQQINNITNQYVFVTDLFNFIVGIISNVLIILVFTSLKIFRGNQCAFYLTVESIADIGLILANIPSDIAAYVLGQSLSSTSIVWCKIQLMCSYAFGVCSLYTICLLAFDQYLSTNPQYSWRQMSTLKLAHRLVFINACFAILHSIIFLFFAEIYTLGCGIYNPAAKIYFTFVYYPILSSTLPMTINVSFSLLAYRNARRIIRRHVPVIRRRLDRELTAIALARVLCITILGLPFIGTSVYHLTLNNNEDNYIKLAISQLLSAISLSLLSFNYSINFFVFLIVSPRFRHQVKHFWVKKCWWSLKRWCSTRPTALNGNRVGPEPLPQVISIVESM